MAEHETSPTIVGHLDSRTGKPATIYTPPECLVRPVSREPRMTGQGLSEEERAQVARSIHEALRSNHDGWSAVYAEVGRILAARTVDLAPAVAELKGHLTPQTAPTEESETA